jgi:hypothetical protein
MCRHCMHAKVGTHPVGEPLQHRNAPARHGFVAFVPDVDVLPPGVLRPELDHFLSGGINTEGLSCDGQTVSSSATCIRGAPSRPTFLPFHLVVMARREHSQGWLGLEQHKWAAL